MTLNLLSNAVHVISINFMFTKTIEYRLLLRMKTNLDANIQCICNDFYVFEVYQCANCILWICIRKEKNERK